MENTLTALLVIFIIIVIIGILLLPYLVARSRGHVYRNIILVLCIFGFSGVTWVIALIWALYPSEKSLIDPVLGNPTGTGIRNVGDTLGSVKFGQERGYAAEKGNDLVISKEVERNDTPAPSRFCGSCGASRHTDATFCTFCGKSIKLVS